MDVYELHSELVEKAKTEFEEIKQLINFEFGDIERESFKVTISKVYLEHIEDAMRYGGLDIPILLFHDKPLATFFEWFEVQGKTLLDVMLEEVFSDFSVAVRKDIEIICTAPVYYDEETVRKADRCYKLMIELSEQVKKEYEQEQLESSLGEQDDEWDR